jgi:hypothetical protein
VLMMPMDGVGFGNSTVTPGAAMSTDKRPKLENEARVSSGVVAATEITLFNCILAG